MKIIRFEAENIKRLRAVAITPVGNVVQITGANGQGKTSVLDAIYWALAGTKGITSRPVREGEESAYVKLDLGEYVVTRKFKSDGSSTLHVMQADGIKPSSPQALLDSLLGSLTFDPLAFSRMDAKRQRAELGAMLGIDQQLSKLNAEIKRDYDIRTETNREVKQLAARIEGMQVSAHPVEPVNVTELLAELKHRDEINRLATYAVQRTAGLRDKAKSLREEAERLRQRAAQCDADASVNEGEADVMAAEQATADNTADLRERIANAQSINAEHARRQEREQLRVEMHAVRSTSEKLSDAITEREEMKRVLLDATEMPIAGLGLAEEGVTYKGVPFEQASGAEQLRVSAAIAMAANPRLRIMRIKDGSLLDDRSLGMLEALAVDHDWQIWIEQVSTSGTVGIVMEDGEVIADNTCEVTL